jgi:hypothetical protein
MTGPASGDAKPGWWVQNERLREEMGLPPYEPPRFADGVPTFETVERIEERYGCTIRFRGINTEYPDDLTVTVDGDPVATIGRYRDNNANTVYEMTSERFREVLERALDGR